MDRGWIRRTIGLLSLILALVLPLIAYADRTERIEQAARESKHVVLEAKPKRTVLAFEETHVEAVRALPELTYSTLFEPPSSARSKGTLVRLRQNFDDKLVDSVLLLGSG